MTPHDVFQLVQHQNLINQVLGSERQSYGCDQESTRYFSQRSASKSERGTDIDEASICVNKPGNVESMHVASSNIISYAVKMVALNKDDLMVQKEHETSLKKAEDS